MSVQYVDAGVHQRSVLCPICELTSSTDQRLICLSRQETPSSSFDRVTYLLTYFFEFCLRYSNPFALVAYICLLLLKLTVKQRSHCVSTASYLDTVVWPQWRIDEHMILPTLFLAIVCTHLSHRPAWWRKEGWRMEWSKEGEAMMAKVGKIICSSIRHWGQTTVSK